MHNLFCKTICEILIEKYIDDRSIASSDTTLHKVSRTSKKLKFELEFELAGALSICNKSFSVYTRLPVQLN